MNLDRLLKLLKLANHNPNDAEANSAARAAAKLLGEENYKWVEDAKKNGGKPKPNISEDRSIIYEEAGTKETIIRISQIDIHANPIIGKLVNHLRDEISKRGTWAGVHRSTEPDFKSTREQYNRGHWTDWNPFNDTSDWEKRYADVEREVREAANRRRKEREETERKARENAGKSDRWTWTGESDNRKRYKKTYIQVCRYCTVCKQTRLTTDEETPYICYECRTRS